LVYEEASQGDAVQSEARVSAIRPFRVLHADKECQAFAQSLVKARVVPESYPEDALHLAIATLNGIEVVLTWNFAHINNITTRGKLREFVRQAGFESPEIVTPEELLEGNDG
jgi:hypothetical protein